MSKIIAEIIAIGDELVSGQRLDTNSQWLSGRLSELGIEPSYHSCVGDGLETGIEVFKQAIARADIVVSTGGIGPTKDDLTRQVIADVAQVPLEHNADVENHIRAIFESYGREMPENNRIQAFFPTGCNIIANQEGTAPGIDLKIGDSRVFALPGVPYEMKQMWLDHVLPAILQSNGTASVIKNHVIHCFGAGESQIEQMLDGMTNRDHVPRVGITASHSTISLRITAIAESDVECDRQVQTVAEKAERLLGDLVFGSNGVELQDVVAQELSATQRSISIIDFGFGGSAAAELFVADNQNLVIEASVKQPSQLDPALIESEAHAIRNSSRSDIGVAISAIRETENGHVYDVAIVDENGTKVNTLRYAGHSGLKAARTRKQILNQIRLFLATHSE